MRILVGIYQILNIVNGKFYIGKSLDVCKRWLNHKSLLRRNLSKNLHLQSAWNKYGENSFEFILIEICEKENISIREQYWIDILGACDSELGYNLNPNSENSLGVRRSLQTKIKISLANKGKKRTPEQIKRMSGRKRIFSEETKLKLSNSKIGKRHSREVIARIALGHRKPDKWPHDLGAKCQCTECIQKRRKLARDYAKAKRQKY